MKMRKGFTGRGSRKFGDARERDLTKRGGYAHTPGSGSSNIKGDLRRGDWMVELKATKHHSFSVTADLIGKLRNDGLTNGKRPVLIVELGTGQKVAVMPLSEFEELVPPE